MTKPPPATAFSPGAVSGLLCEFKRQQRTGFTGQTRGQSPTSSLTEKITWGMQTRDFFGYRVAWSLEFVKNILWTSGQNSALCFRENSKQVVVELARQSREGKRKKGAIYPVKRATRSKIKIQMSTVNLDDSNFPIPKEVKGRKRPTSCQNSHGWRGITLPQYFANITLMII